MSLQANGLYEFGPYRLDAAQRLLTRGDESVVLTPKTFDLLLILVESRGRVLTKKHLIEALWRDTFVDEANLPFQVSALRKALGEEGTEWIETLPKHGYRFTAPVTNVGSDGAGADATEDPSTPWTLRRTAPWLIAGVTTLVAVTVVVLYLRQTPPVDRTIRLLVSPPEKVALSNTLPSVSPDGRRLAFSGVGLDGGAHLWVRELDSLTAEQLPGSEGADSPFWSPDSGSIAFFAGGKLKRIDLHGGPPRTLCDTTAYLRAGGTWSRNGVILFNDSGQSLHRVAATGGEATPATTLDASRQEVLHLWPQFLPDGRHFLYLVQSARSENNGIYVGSLDSKESQRLINTITKAAYAESPSGTSYMLFIRSNTLMAQPFDARGFKTHGEPFPVTEQVQLSSAPNGMAYAAFSASENGVLAYQTGRAATELVWLDRQGKRLGTVGEPADYSNPALSRDEKKLVVCRNDPQFGTRDLWLFDLARGAASRLTFDRSDEANPVWSPDSGQIAFCSTRKGPRDIYQKAASGIGEPELLLESHEDKSPSDWSPDGRFILYSGGWMLPLDGNHKPVGPFPIGTNPQVSPNGRWVAYQSNESGRMEVHVQSFPPSGGKWQISTAGGEEPHWRSDGKELFYIAGNRLMGADVKTEPLVFEAGASKPLFEMRLEALGRRSRYQVASNGQRFLVNVPVETASPSPITVVVNWTAGLKLK